MMTHMKLTENKHDKQKHKKILVDANAHTVDTKFIWIWWKL